MFSFQTHSRGAFVRQTALLVNAQTGTFTLQSRLLLQATPPQCSAPTGDGTAAEHCVRKSMSGIENSKLNGENLRVRSCRFDMLNSNTHFTSRAQRNPIAECLVSGGAEERNATFTPYSS